MSLKFKNDYRNNFELFGGSVFFMNTLLEMGFKTIS